MWYVIEWFARLNYTVILLVITSVILFGFYIPTRIPSVYTENIFPSVFIDGVSDEKNLVGKDYYRIPTKTIYRYFCLYLSIFWWCFLKLKKNKSSNIIKEWEGYMSCDLVLFSSGTNIKT